MYNSMVSLDFTVLFLVLQQPWIVMKDLMDDSSKRNGSYPARLSCRPLFPLEIALFLRHCKLRF